MKLGARYINLMVKPIIFYYLFVCFSSHDWFPVFPWHCLLQHHYAFLNTISIPNPIVYFRRSFPYFRNQFCHSHEICAISGFSVISQKKAEESKLTKTNVRLELEVSIWTTDLVVLFWLWYPGEEKSQLCTKSMH